ncbi:uncharacterized protein LOC135487203 [Lineus longissimus]|uniref:uncharacterized protein LOC135487203 n=1 Tax=Lineus longissimus TaxID=88925 RepID=UPI002B4DC701
MEAPLVSELLIYAIIFTRYSWNVGGVPAFQVLTGSASGKADDSPSTSPPCPTKYVAIKCEAVGPTDGSYMLQDGRCQAKKSGSPYGTVTSRIFCMYTNGKVNASHPEHVGYVANPTASCPAGTEVYGCNLHSPWRPSYPNSAVAASTLNDTVQCQVTNCQRCRVGAHCLSSRTLKVYKRQAGMNGIAGINLKSTEPAHLTGIETGTQLKENIGFFQCAASCRQEASCVHIIYIETARLCFFKLL